ncbi:DNA topoisomerase-1 [Sphingomonas kyeonggiensis]|uniref:DNA topoisomerase IB n=1 Tax=Sphingomonas kyeonggiensis TaxID=1268553 RepID=UPI002783CC19|nr:DNA topoisomerase IB [Sphingomonas kyeonggiensis]MDQ0251770.1 DNA topoisomerase-1 [Sphingomonas kyeonggiensis]
MPSTDIVYVDDQQPGITRRKVRHGWGYWDAEGERIKDRDAIDRLNAIGLPPAYHHAWFCPDPRGHIQATGYDEKGRKQYRYHTGFREAQEAAKYDRCASFGEHLAKLRARVEHDLKLRGLCKEKAVAAVVRLLDLGSIRVGNEQYVQANKSFGATTLRKRHAVVKGQTLRLQFRAKSGKLRVMTITDGSLSRFVRKCQDLPGQHLFRWLDDAGEAHPVTSSDVNAYIREATSEDFTAKHFRTWGASVIAFRALAAAGEHVGLKAMLEPVTEALGNTPAIARKSYVHPALVDLAKDREAQAEWRAGCHLPRATRWLNRYERGLIAFLEGLAAHQQPRKAA